MNYKYKTCKTVKTTPRIPARDKIQVKQRQRFTCNVKEGGHQWLSGLIKELLQQTQSINRSASPINAAILCGEAEPGGGATRHGIGARHASDLISVRGAGSSG